MICLTGDTHIPNNIAKLNMKNFPEQKNLTRDDYIIVLGDFGHIHQDKNFGKFTVLYNEIIKLK